MKIESLHKHFLESTGVCTDTRKIIPGCVFFALKGENFNGNSFATTALEMGATLAVVDEEQYHTKENTWLCDDVLKTLQKLATFHRNFLKIPIIALTGSNGKTTSKELIHAVLSQKYHCIATKGNLNNHIGVPLTLLSMDRETEIGLVEMGANHLGEIALLVEIANPDYGYITNFGKAHLEGFGSLEGVIKGKSELYRFLKLKHKKVFVNGEDAKQMELTQNFDRIIFNGSNSNNQIQLLEKTKQLKVRFQEQEIQTQLIGSYNFSNIAAAIAMGNYFKVPVEQIKKALEDYTPQMNRSQVIEKDHCKIILDAYNANPTSMMAALQNFKNLEGTPKILVLGDMFELGTEAAKEHQKIVDFIEANPFEKTYLIGKNFFATKTNSSEIQKFELFEDFKNHLTQHSIKNSFLLIKGSRGMALERVLDII